eukprot:TRINITY_DN1194_c0_g1_i1.p1 TRINITY_DN1194_c0_g1~~TRINITY_DN1194_c0_g1_i1.p1  ORF type:complete len:437 (+),score=59.37 TRINITY_DN1194_c0_g1_i1:29-1312(+)
MEEGSQGDGGAHDGHGHDDGENNQNDQGDAQPGEDGTPSTPGRDGDNGDNGDTQNDTQEATTSQPQPIPVTFIGGLEEVHLKTFCLDLIRVLCGQEPIPGTQTSIKDRSVHPDSDRHLALDYLTSLIQAFPFAGPATVEQQRWKQEDGLPMANLIVTLEGSENKEQAVIFGAHYDVQNSLSPCWRGSKGAYMATQGADDNASGTVACVALLKKFTVQQPKQTTVVVLFDGEEPGEWNGLAEGSGRFVEEYVERRGLKASGCFVVDMVGGEPTTHHGFVLSVSDLVDHEALQVEFKRQGRFNTKNKKCVVTVAPKSSRINLLKLSDSLHFPKKKIPTVLLCNVAGFSTVPHFYHTEHDQLHQIKWTSFMRAVDIIFFLQENTLPVFPKINPDHVLTLTQMGYSRKSVEAALEQSKNDLDQALQVLLDG